jgi:Spy/CpxP family protein refolding chaperone
MKRMTMLALVMMGVVAVGSARGQGGMKAGAQLPDPDRVMQMMTAKLGLTADQQAKIAPVIADRQQQVRALMADTSSRPFQKQRKVKEIRESSDKKINAVLTPDQRKQYAELEEQMKEEMKERREEKKDAAKTPSAPPAV